MVAIIAAGVLSHAGKMDLTASIAVATVANTLGDTMLFYLARYNKSAVMPYLATHKRKLAYSHILMKRYGDKIILIKKFIYGVKTLVPIAVGLTKYSFVKFSAINFISSLIWAVVLRAGDYLGAHGYIMPLAMGCALGAIWYFLQKATAKKGKR